MSKAKVIHKDGLFVRKDKSRSSEWVRIIPCGEEFEFYEEYKGWLKVADGWVVCNDVYIKPVDVTGGGGVSSWNDLTDKPFGEEIVNEHIEWFSHTYTDVVVSQGNTTSMKFTHEGDLPTYTQLNGEHVTLKYESPTTNKVITLDKFANYYGTMQATSSNPDTKVSLTWTKSNGVYNIDVLGLYGEFGEDSDVTITVALEVDRETHHITTIEPQLIPFVIIEHMGLAEEICINKTFEEVCWSVINIIPFMTFVRDRYGFDVVNRYRLLSEDGSVIEGAKSPSEVYAIAFVHSTGSTGDFWLKSDNTITCNKPSEFTN